MEMKRNIICLDLVTCRRICKLRNGLKMSKPCQQRYQWKNPSWHQTNPRDEQCDPWWVEWNL